MNALAKLRGYWTPVAIMAFTAAFLWMTYRLPTQSRAMPLGVAWTTLALAAIDLVSRTRTGLGAGLMKALNPAGDADVEAERSGRSWRRQALGVALPLIFTALLIAFGILVGPPLFIFAAIFLSDRRRWLEALVITLGATLFIWLVFAVLLKLALFQGLVFGASL